MIDLPYQPREQFVDFHQRTQRNALMVCHRRMGKTVGCVGDLIVRARLIGQSHAEIADELGKSAGATRVALHRALAQLASLMDGADE